MVKYLRGRISSGQAFYKAMALLGVVTVIGGGVIFKYGVTRPAGHTTDQHIASNFTAVELTSGCVDAETGTGACLQVISGVTNDHTIFTKSGGLLVGPFASPKLSVVASGATTIRPTNVNGVGLAVAATISGSALNIQGLKTASSSALCVKTTGLFGRCSDATAADGECTCI